MALILYELGGRDGRRYSQFSWRTRLALAHKGLDYDTVPVAVSDKAAIAFSNQDKVPILRDGEQVIADSWRIAEHLETAYPDRPSLFGGERGHAFARFVNFWADRQLMPRLAPMMLIDVLGIVDDKDAAHLRRTLEPAFKRSFEELSSRRAEDVVAFRRLLDPARQSLRTQPFVSGATPAYADYILFSMFQWARLVSTFELLEPADALAAWRERMLDLYDGFARKENSRAASG
jgi:glutathione S-transferase